jgi:hypothetical protein
MGAIAAVLATASLAGGTLSLKLRYEMVCGQPGRGPVVVHLPTAFRLSRPQVRARGEARPFTVAGKTVTISLWKPPRITCMSITEGVLPIRIGAIGAPAGTYAVRGTVNGSPFTAALRVLTK